MTTTITRAAYPHLWSLFALVSATMGLAPTDHVAVYTAQQIAGLEYEMSGWLYHSVLVLAGVVDDEALYHVLVRTSVGRLAHHVLSMQ